MKTRDGKRIKEIVFIGEKFYEESQTIMSSVYELLPNGKWQRYDYGFLQLDIQSGKNIYIRPATKQELRLFEGKLNEMLVMWGYQPGMFAGVHDNTPDFWEHVGGISEPFEL